MVRNGKAIADKTVGGIFLCVVLCPGEQVRIVQVAQWSVVERLE